MTDRKYQSKPFALDSGSFQAPDCRVLLFFPAKSTFGLSVLCLWGQRTKVEVPQAEGDMVVLRKKIGDDLENGISRKCARMDFDLGVVKDFKIDMRTAKPC